MLARRGAHRDCATARGRAGAAGHRDRRKAASRSVSAIIGEQEFAAPERRRLAPADAVERDAEHRRRIERAAVLGEASGDMGVMMCTSISGRPSVTRVRAPSLRREVFGMAVGREDRRRVIEQRRVERQIAR